MRGWSLGVENSKHLDILAGGQDQGCVWGDSRAADPGFPARTMG